MCSQLMSLINEAENNAASSKIPFKTLVEFQVENDEPVSVSLSASGQWLAYGHGNYVFIGRWRNRRPHLSNLEELDVKAKVQDLMWSSNSKYLLISLDHEGRSLLVSIDDPTKIVCLSELENVGLQKLLWSYDSRFVIGVAPCSLGTVIFEIDSIRADSRHWLPGARSINGKPLLALSPDSQYLALVSAQSLLLYNTENWLKIWQTQTECILISGVSWFPDSMTLFVWDSLARLCVDFLHLDGTSKYTISPVPLRQESIRAAAVSPCTSLFATFNEDYQIRLYNTLVWQLVTILDEISCYSCKDDFQAKLQAPLSTDSLSCHSWKPFICWSACGRYLAFASSAYSTIWTWSAYSGTTEQFCLGKEDGIGIGVTDLLWHPNKPILTAATGSRCIHLWQVLQSETKTESFECSFVVHELRWQGNKPSFLLVNAKPRNHVAVICVR